MKLFGIQIGQEKPVPFVQFRDMVRLTARRKHPRATLENTENGFNLILDEKTQICNLQQLYRQYCKNTRARELLIQTFVNDLVVETPAHTWIEVMSLLRPLLKSSAFVQEAQRGLQSQNPPDSMPSQPFVGDLHVILVVDQPGHAWGVTQTLLDGWGVALEEAMLHALNNLSMAPFPNPSNTLHAGGATKKGGIQEEVGLVFEGNYLTATWLIMERFRDYLGQRLQGDYVVAAPSRSKLTAVRADEQGLIANLIQANRTFHNQSYPLTGQLFHVSASKIGGEVTVYQPGGQGEALGTDSLFAAGKSQTLPSISHAAAGISQKGLQGVELNSWYGLNEPTDESDAQSARGKKGGGKQR